MAEREAQILKRVADLEQRYEDIVIELTRLGELAVQQGVVNRHTYDAMKLLIDTIEVKPHSPFNKGERL